MKNLRIYLLAWLGLVVIAMLNGALRVAGYSEYMSGLAAHQLATVIGICLFAIYFWVLAKHFPLTSTKEALTIGGAWLVLTISFEFLFGHFVAGIPWSTLLADYNLLNGRVWLLVLIWTFIGPLVFYKIKQRT
jgi:hypothetical protein